LIYISNCNFFMQQLLRHDMEKEDESKKEAEIVGEYFFRLNLWLDAYFEGLRTIDKWELFYVHLVGIVVKIANAQSTDQGDQIDANNVVMPRVNDIFQACRLMYQAIGSLRIALSDGQHRMAAILNLLSRWTIKIESRKFPPKAFVRELDSTDEVTARLYFKTLLENLADNLAGRVMVRILAPNTHFLEEDGVGYSLERERSQSHHKKRGLLDA
jgi:hypothetical protein